MVRRLVLVTTLIVNQGDCKAKKFPLYNLFAVGAARDARHLVLMRIDEYKEGHRIEHDVIERLHYALMAGGADEAIYTIETYTAARHDDSVVSRRCGF